MPVQPICTMEELADELQTAEDKLVIVEFFATWCGYCQRFAPQLEVLSRTEPNCVFLKVDVDLCADLAQYYGIHSMPTMIIFKNQQSVDLIEGADIDTLKETIDH